VRSSSFLDLGANALRRLPGLLEALARRVLALERAVERIERVVERGLNVVEPLGEPFEIDAGGLEVLDALPLDAFGELAFGHVPQCKLRGRPAW
jgi:hypothetical protein